MKKQILGFALVATSVLAMGTQVHAAEEGKSEIGVGFTNSETVKPDGPYRHNLSLIAHPADFNFGQKNKINAKTLTLPVVESLQNPERVLSVYDDRDAADDAKKGWKLEAKLSEFAKKGAAEGEDDKLNASLLFKTTDLKKFVVETPESASEDIVMPEDIYNGAQSELVGTQAGIEGKATQYTLVPGVAQTIMAVTDGDDNFKGGVATTIKDLTLSVSDAENIKNDSQYTGNVTWSISNAYTGK